MEYSRLWGGGCKPPRVFGIRELFPVGARSICTFHKLGSVYCIACMSTKTLTSEKISADCSVKENSIFGMCCQLSEASLDIDAVRNWDV